MVYGSEKCYSVRSKLYTTQGPGNSCLGMIDNGGLSPYHPIICVVQLSSMSGNLLAAMCLETEVRLVGNFVTLAGCLSVLLARLLTSRGDFVQ